MSYAVVHMQKIKSPALKGMQIHHQRERESKTNPDIDEDRSKQNYDLANDENIDFTKRVNEIIESQKKGTRKTRKDAVLVNELLITSDKEFFERLDPAEQDRFFEESYGLLAERYGEQNIAYAKVHKDEKTPHLHLGVVPMRDGRLQGKNVFNRQELLWLQDKFPEHMRERGFELERGEKGSDRDHIEMARFKKQTLEKEIDSLDKNLGHKKKELSVLSERVPDKVEVNAKKQMKNIEVPTGEKTLFGKEKMKIEKKPTGNVVLSEKDYKRLISAAMGNKQLKGQLNNLLNTDLAKENKNLLERNDQIREKYNGLVHKYNSIVENYNDLVKENKTLKERVGVLTSEISLLYQNTKDFLKGRTESVRAFKNDFKDFVDNVKEKVAGSEFEQLYKREKARERDRGMER